MKTTDVILAAFIGSAPQVSQAEALFISHYQWLRALALRTRLLWFLGLLSHDAATCLIEAVWETLGELRRIEDAGLYLEKGRAAGYVVGLINEHVSMPVGVIPEVYRFLKTL